MKSYDASSTIQASPDTIWGILTDAPNYSAWDSGVIRVEGRIAQGETIKVVSSANPGRTFPVKVTEFQPGRRMVWSGGMPLGLFKGVRTFTLSPEGRGNQVDGAGGIYRTTSWLDLEVDARSRAVVQPVRRGSQKPGRARAVAPPRPPPSGGDGARRLEMCPSPGFVASWRRTVTCSTEPRRDRARAWIARWCLSAGRPTTRSSGSQLRA